MPVSFPSPSKTARTLRLCSRVRCAMLSDSCSIETPAFTRRTLDWLSTSLLKGMSREGDSVIFWTFVICILHNGPPRDSLLATNPSRKSAHSSHSCAGAGGQASRRFVITHDRLLCRAWSSFRNEAEQVIRGFARLRSRTHDGAIIFAKDFEPRADVIGMADGRHDA